MTGAAGRWTRLVLLADSSAALLQSAVRELSLGGDWRCETAATIREARDKIVLLQPTVLVVESEMPGNENGEFVERLLQYHPMPVMVPARTRPAAGLERAVRAWVGKPAGAVRQASYKMGH